jgi:hypothetical protein
MTMTLGKRIAGRLLGWALRIWPGETSAWGRALAAELSVIDTSREALRWALGGLIMLIREWLRHAFGAWRRPVGMPEGSPLAALANPASRLPRTPRFLTALFLCASLGILLIPDSQEAMKATFQLRPRPLDIAVESSDLQPFRQAAQLYHDSEAMAVVAMLSPDRAERIPMAEEAVKLDPSLTWIYAVVPTTKEPWMLASGPIPPGWLARLENWDPDNGFAHMLGAQPSLIRFDDNWNKNGYRGNYFEEAKKQLSNDPAWSAAMEAAFQAPKYDGYFPRMFDVYRHVARRYGIRDPRLALILVARMQSPFPTRNAHIYAEVLPDRAEAAEKSGMYQEAIELYRQPAEVGQRMAGQCHTHSEKLAWAQIEESSLRSLEPLLAKTGQRREAAFARYKLSSLQTDFCPSSPVQDWAWSENGWQGFAIRGLAFGVLLCPD